MLFDQLQSLPQTAETCEDVELVQQLKDLAKNHLEVNDWQF